MDDQMLVWYFYYVLQNNGLSNHLIEIKYAIVKFSIKMFIFILQDVLP